MALNAAFLYFVFATLGLTCRVDGAYLGKSLGKLSEFHHGVSGEVFAVDGRTLHIKDFTYDGQGPAAYFWAGSTKSVGNQGFRIRDENGRPDVLRRYRKEGVTITLPEGKTLRDIKWFSVWCEEFEVNFGDVKISRNFDFPRPQKLAALQGIHGISSDNIVVVDAQTILIPNLSYDGEAPDAKFWAGPGPKPSPQGIRIPDENGKETPLRRYDRKTVVLTLPGELTIFDLGHFGIWCEAFTVDFGHVQIPTSLNVPPSLKMLGVSPQSKLNCEVLYDDLAFEVRWAIAGDSIVLQLVARLEPREYMSFGISGESKETEMIGADVAVAWIDKDTLKGYAIDYYLQDKSQCSGPTGSCPDIKFKPNTNNVRLLNAATVNGYSIVTYQRPLKASDEYDKAIVTNETQAVVWAIGPLNQRDEVSFHSDFIKGKLLVDFGRPAKWNCPMPESEQPNMKTQSATTSNYEAQQQEAIKEASEDVTDTPKLSRTRNGERRRGPNRGGQQQLSQQQEQHEEIEKSATRRPSERRGSIRTTQKSLVSSRGIPTPAPVKKRDAWEIPPILCNEPDDGVFYAQMGPTGGKHGYPAITGHVGWGISWYINGLLIPEINVVRGQTYTFVVEGGLDPEVPARYHPFYITDDPIGGYEYKTPEERKAIKIFAGAVTDEQGKTTPIGVGRLCHWTHQGDTDADDFESFGAYQRTLELKCDQGEPGVIQWTPDKDTPDTVYYQCFTHRYLGWKINVLDKCDLSASGSDPQPVYVAPPHPLEDLRAPDLEASSSIAVETRVKPNHIQEEDKNLGYNIYNMDFHGPAKFPNENDEEDQITFLHPPAMIPPIPNTNPAQPPTESYLNQSNFNAFPLKEQRLKNAPHRTPYLPSKIIRMPPPSNRPVPFMIQNHRMNRPNVMMHKKTYYRPQMKPTMIKRPLNKYDSKGPYPLMTAPVKNIAMLPPIFLNTQERPEQVMHVEISPQQASTEKEPNSTYEVNMPLAVNTGFHPETIVIEGGFRPIIRKEVEHRSADANGPELEYESSIGVIDVYDKPAGDLRPVFRPSPLDSQKKHANKINKRASFKKDPRLIIKRPRSQEVDGDSDEDIKPQAAERVESYYLPPTNKKPKDRDAPPETVVTYDGKKVSGASLSIRLNDGLGPSSDARTSKASDILKSTPQFTPFTGELPPLSQDFIDRNAPQLKQRSGLSRNLDTPDLPPPTLRLRPVRNGNEEILNRSKRSPHHTPEHTEQQKRENLTRESSDSKLTKSSFTLVATIFLLTSMIL